jgi:hypothetical protein
MPPAHVLDRTTRERVHYFSRQLITAEDMIDEQNFFLQKFRRHNRFLHGWGVVCGYSVVAAATAQYPWRVKICDGYVVDPHGNEIDLGEPFFFDLAAHRPTYDPCAPRGGSHAPVSRGSGDAMSPLFLAVCYDECDTRPVRVHAAGCGCETSCEYSRVRDSFCFTVLPELPEYHTKAVEADAAFVDALRAWAKAGRDGPLPAAPCPVVTADPCVVLAQVSLPAVGTALDASAIDNTVRRTLYSTHALELLMQV